MIRSAGAKLHPAEALLRPSGPLASHAHAKPCPSIAIRSFYASTTFSKPSANTATVLNKRILTPNRSQLPYLHKTALRTFVSTVRMAGPTRTETDAFGEIQVPSDRYWGAQTERSLENFKINQPQDRMPPPIVRAFGILKGAAATVNMKFGLGRYRKTNCRSSADRSCWKTRS
jgi:fumarate hydratase class II